MSREACDIQNQQVHASASQMRESPQARALMGIDFLWGKLEEKKKVVANQPIVSGVPIQ